LLRAHDGRGRFAHDGRFQPELGGRTFGGRFGRQGFAVGRGVGRGGGLFCGGLEVGRFCGGREVGRFCGGLEVGLLPPAFVGPGRTWPLLEFCIALAGAMDVITKQIIKSAETRRALAIIATS
jgi:hypothetical protein